MEEAWVLNIRDQCIAAGVPFFFKQWGGVRKSAAGRELNGSTYDEMPLRSVAEMVPRKVRLAMIGEIDAECVAG